ncbi:MAG: diguanylate cyclase [Defluviitaleaceae bacterium]|nr:diguanylate cyclase [Defluviitaleaceae bacterium]
METKKNSVLIVDDETINLKILMQILNHDYEVYIEKTGNDCLSAAKKVQPDLILLDILMPDIDGFQVIKKLKADTETEHIPVIFITGLSNSASEIQGFMLGAVDYIHKPFVDIIVKMRIQSQMKIINLLRKIKNMSVTDDLTGIGNRRYFNAQLSQEWERAKRQQSPLSFIIMDVDNFKRFNDDHGHLKGDVALVGVADVIRAVITRAGDKAARWGGEEFAVILPDTDLTGASKIAEDIRTSVENYILVLEDEKTAKITVSMGLHCIIPQHGGDYSLDSFVADADRALYRAKNSGRNKVCIAERQEM